MVNPVTGVLLHSVSLSKLGVKANISEIHSYFFLAGLRPVWRRGRVRVLKAPQAFLPSRSGKGPVPSLPDPFGRAQAGLAFLTIPRMVGRKHGVPAGV